MLYEAQIKVALALNQSMQQKSEKILFVSYIKVKTKIFHLQMSFEVSHYLKSFTYTV